MKVYVKESFKWARGGVHVETVGEGEQDLEGRALEIAKEKGVLGDVPKRRGRPPKVQIPEVPEDNDGESSGE